MLLLLLYVCFSYWLRDKSIEKKEKEKKRIACRSKSKKNNN